MYRPLTKKEAYAFTRAAYRFMGSHDTVLLGKIPSEFARTRLNKKKRKYIVYGTYEWDEEGAEIIKVDYRYDIIATLIHELLHFLHNDWRESKVRQQERRYLRGLSGKQIFNLLRCFTNCARLTKS
jgi:hypothetical protein